MSLSIKRSHGGWRPGRAFPLYNRPLATKKAKLRRLVAKGLAPSGDKGGLRALADDAMAGRIPRKA